MVPSISRFQWHPFTVAGGSQDGVLTLHVKRYGAFTKVGAGCAQAAGLQGRTARRQGGCGRRPGPSSVRSMLVGEPCRGRLVPHALAHP